MRKIPSRFKRNAGEINLDDFEEFDWLRIFHNTAIAILIIFKRA
jgi:hypothetical protein